jgi:hypothetical protein
MIYKICDFCKKSQIKEDLEMKLPYIASVVIEKKEGWEYIIGRKFRFEICTECFESLIKRVKN